MSSHDVWHLGCDFLPQRPIYVEPVEEYLAKRLVNGVGR